MYVTLTQLKERLLIEARRSDYSWDATLQLIGDSVCSSFDTYANRTLSYTVGKQDVFRASLDAWTLSAYPVVSITAVDTRDSASDGWQAETVNDVVWNVDEQSGLVEMLHPMGVAQEHVRLTHTGGYWYPTTTYTTLPAGATALPNDLLGAFYRQCQVLFELESKNGANLLGANRPMGWLYTAELDKHVEAVLKFYRRYQVT